MSTPQLRPLGIGEILDVGMKIAWRNAGTLIRVVVVVVLPIQLLSTLIAVSATPDGFEYSGGEFGVERVDPFAEVSAAEIAALVTGGIFVLILAIVSYLVSTGACYRAIVSAYLGDTTGWRESLGYAARRAHSLLWISILAFLAIVLGLIACIIPGIYLAVCFSVAVPVLLTEGARGSKALGRSRRLVSGSWWRVLAVLILSAILVGIFQLVISGLAAGLTSTDVGSSTLALAVQQVIVGTISSALTTPLAAAFSTILYFDLRVRKEAFDLQLLADRLGVEPPAGYVAPAEPTPEQPPFWPPPPGWQPSQPGSEPPPPDSAGWPPPPGPSDWPPKAPDEQPPEGGGEQPPFWPPPPDWKPPSDR